MKMDFKNSDKTLLCINIAVWVICVVLFFSPAIFGGKVLAPLDCLECVFRPFATHPIEQVHNQYNVDGASQYLPYSWAMQQSWKEDGYMGWNPYTHNGTSLPENTMLSPGDWHHWLFAFLPFWTAWDTGIILQFFLAGLGMIILLRSRNVPFLYTLLGAVSFSFYSQFIMWMYDRWLGAMIWAPWIVWALLRGREKRRVIDVPSVIFISLGFRGGHLQSCTFIFLLVLCVFLADWWRRENRWSWKIFVNSAWPYFISGVLAALLSLDVFVDTLPRMEGCKSLSFIWSIGHLPSLITSIIPTVLGVPQTISLFRVMDADLFDIKFGGGIVFILAILGLFNSRAPLTAKFCFVISLVASFSPLASFLYSRSTTVMALGMAWLAAWQLYDLSLHSQRPIWRKITWWGVWILLVWFLGSVVVQLFHEPLLAKLQGLMDHNIMTAQQEGRRSWYYMRVEKLLAQLMIWDWRNMAFIVLIGTGLWACSHLNVSSRQPWVWAGLVALCTFGEQLVFSSSWLAYADKPATVYLYAEPEWLPELRQNVKDGSVEIVNPHGDLDFLCTNHLSTYGIRLAGGYETVQPKWLKPLGQGYDPEDYAKAGISHLLYDAQARIPILKGWRLVQKTSGFYLLANTEYRGRYFIQSGADDVFRSVNLDWRTCNKMHFTVPAGTRKLIVLESYSRGWSARMKGGGKIPVERTERNGLQIPVPDTGRETGILLQYHTPYRAWYYGIMGGTAIFLILTILYQRWKRYRQEC